MRTERRNRKRTKESRSRNRKRDKDSKQEDRPASHSQDATLEDGSVDVNEGYRCQRDVEEGGLPLVRVYLRGGSLVDLYRELRPQVAVQVAGLVATISGLVATLGCLISNTLFDFQLGSSAGR